MTEYRKLIDSSVWLAYFLLKEPKISKIINEEDNALFSSAISIHEIKKKLLLAKTDPAKISESLDFLKDNSIVIDISEDILEKSADDSARHNFSLADSIIYRSALDNNAQIITLDTFFSGKKGAIVLK